MSVNNTGICFVRWLMSYLRFLCLFTLREQMSLPPGCWWGQSCSLFYVLSYYVSLRSELWCTLRYPHKTMFGSSLPPVVCRSVHVLFTLFMFVFVKRCPTHIVLGFSLSCVPILPVSLDCSFLIVPSVFSDVYFVRWLMGRMTFARILGLRNVTFARLLELSKKVKYR